jgi:dienelactone hydrolase
MLQAVLKPALAIAMACLVTAGCATSVVRFPNATPGAPRIVSGWLSRPSGAGPFPAVVLLHGCAGVSASNHDWARWFTDRGYAAFVVDSWTPRGMTDGCGPNTDVPNTERLDDAVGALRYLHTLPWVDRDRIGAIGWSNGGVFSMSVINGPSLERARRRGVIVPDPGFQAAVGVYPGGCYSLVKEQVVRPLLVLIGDADDWTLPSLCVEMGESMRKRGADVTVVLFPGAVHYFDVEGQPRAYLPDVANRNKPNECCGASVGFDPAASADAHRRVADFFGYHLRKR